MKVCAGIVLYNPDIERLKECVDAALPQVDRLVFVDNASGNIDEVQKEIAGENFIWIRNNENLGIAAALNQLIEFAANNDFEWVLTLDQDSICEGEMIEKLSFVVKEEVAIIAPLVIDRGVPEMKQPGKEPLPETDDVKMCITSGSLTNVKAVLDAGGFDEWLFIYDVDREICIRLLRKGYRLVRVNGAKLFHEHGLKTVSRKFLWKKIIYRNYTPISVYYMTRNLVFMLRKYGKEYTSNPFLRKIRMYIAFSVKFIFEPDRMQRLKAFRKGVKEGKMVDINETREVTV